MMMTMMMMLMVTITIIMVMMLMLMLSRIAFFNTVSNENYEEVHPEQSALATLSCIFRQVVQHCLASSYRFNTVSNPFSLSLLHPSRTKH